MMIFHEAMDELEQRLLKAEQEKSKWLPVGDIIIENLQDEVAICKVCNTIYSHFKIT